MWCVNLQVFDDDGTPRYLNLNPSEGNVGIVPDSIKQKAIKHAIERDKQGLDPFYQDDEESISNQAQNSLDDINIFKY